MKIFAPNFRNFTPYRGIYHTNRSIITKIFTSRARSRYLHP